MGVWYQSLNNLWHFFISLRGRSKTYLIAGIISSLHGVMKMHLKGFVVPVAYKFMTFITLPGRSNIYEVHMSRGIRAV